MDTAGYVVLVSFISALLVAAFLALCAYVVLYRRRFCRGCASVPDDYERSIASSSVRSFHVDGHIGHRTAAPLPSEDVLLHRLFWNNQQKSQQPITFGPETPVAGTAADTNPFVAFTPLPIIRRGKQEAAFGQYPVDKKSNVAPVDLAVARFRERHGSKILSDVSDATNKEEKMVPIAGADSKGGKEDAMTAEVLVRTVARDGKEGKVNNDVREGTIEETAVQFYTPPASPLNDDISWSTPPHVPS